MNNNLLFSIFFILSFSTFNFLSFSSFIFMIFSEEISLNKGSNCCTFANLIVNSSNSFLSFSLTFFKLKVK